MKGNAPSGTAVLAQEQELFGCQNLVTFRTDIENQLKKMKGVWRGTDNDDVSPEFMEEMQGLQSFQDRINMARAVCGDGPFVAFKVDNLPEEGAVANGHPQMVHVQTYKGTLRATSGELFSRV